MAIFSKSPEAAQNAVTKAEKVVREWEAKAAEARAEAARLDAESGAAILEDETAAERITLNVQTFERKARAYDQAAEEARRKLNDAQRAALEAEAREEDKLFAAARKEAQAHDAKVDNLLQQLKDLDGVAYAVAGSEPGYAPTTKSSRLTLEARSHEVRAALIRYFIKTGEITHEVYDLNTVLGTEISSLLRTIPGEGIEIPTSIQEARSAGLTFAE